MSLDTGCFNIVTYESVFFYLKKQTCILCFWLYKKNGRGKDVTNICNKCPNIILWGCAYCALLFCEKSTCFELFYENSSVN